MLGCLILSAGLFDSQRTSSIISVSLDLIALFCCIRTTFFRVKSMRIQIPDILFCCYFMFAAFKMILILIFNQLGDIIIHCYYVFASG